MDDMGFGDEQRVKGYMADFSNQRDICYPTRMPKKFPTLPGKDSNQKGKGPNISPTNPVGVFKNDIKASEFKKNFVTN